MEIDESMLIDVSYGTSQTQAINKPTNKTEFSALTGDEWDQSMIVQMGSA